MTPENALVMCDFLMEATYLGAGVNTEQYDCLITR